MELNLFCTEGLEEGIRCAICTNSMKSDTGCDGGCIYDKKLYEKILNVIKNSMISWIPVSKELPREHVCDDGFIEPSDNVLILRKSGEYAFSRYWGSRESYKDRPWIDISYPTTDEVVAWMPFNLPKFKEN